MGEKDLTNLELLSTFSHEFRTPLNSIIGFSEILLEEEAKPDRREKLEFIRQGGQLLLSMVENILDFQMALRGRLIARPTPFSMCDLVKQVEILHGPTAREKGLTFSASCGEDIPSFVAGDKQRLHRILGHLIDNAIKFTARGSVSLEARYADGRGTFLVCDTGIGFAQGDQQRLFRAFEQGENDLRRSYGGLGIGLTLAKSFTEALGGTLDLDSEPGKGTTATVCVPLHEAAIPEKGTVERNDGRMVRGWLQGVARDDALVDAVFDLLRSLPGFYAKVADAFSRDNLESILMELHDMKGATGNLGMQELYRAIRALEEAVRQKRPRDEQAALFSDLRQVFRLIPEDFFSPTESRSANRAPTVTPASLSPADRDILEDVLERLERNRRIFDPTDLLGLATTLSGSAKDAEQELAASIRQAAESFDEEGLGELILVVEGWLNA